MLKQCKCIDYSRIRLLGAMNSVEIVRTIYDHYFFGSVKNISIPIHRTCVHTRERRFSNESHARTLTQISFLVVAMRNHGNASKVFRSSQSRSHGYVDMVFV